MAEVFYTGMLGPEAVKKLNELYEVAANSAAGIVSISSDSDNALTLGNDAGLYVPAVDPNEFFQVHNKFYEISQDEPAKQTARVNLGLDTIDGGTFN